MLAYRKTPNIIPFVLLHVSSWMTHPCGLNLYRISTLARYPLSLICSVLTTSPSLCGRSSACSMNSISILLGGRIWGSIIAQGVSVLSCPLWLHPMADLPYHLCHLLSPLAACCLSCVFGLARYLLL
ncbi:hypothetical protein EDC04DRAFT_2679193, partial [Pisolithus marmoratus]